MIKYTFRENEPVLIRAAKQADAQVIGEALAKIAEASDGELTPSAIVEVARSKKHPLHPHFEWDDAVAAEAFRLDQARHLIRIVRVEDDTAEDGTSPAYISINDGAGRMYRPLEQVKRSVDLQLALLKQAGRELESWERRYRNLGDICKQVREAREKIEQRIGKQENRVAA